MPPLNRTETRLDLEELRQKLASATGKTYWRGLEELAETPQFQEFLEREFPDHAADPPAGFDRRAFLSLMAASLGLAGLSGCARLPGEKLVPYVHQPEEVIPGRSLFFATAMTLAGYATGLVVRSREGRPIKIEGNPDHPASKGATDPFAQASILDLYDPARRHEVSHVGNIRSWDEALTLLGERLRAAKRQGGRGVRFLTPAVSSPTVIRLLSSLLKDMPEARWHQYEPAGDESALAGADVVFEGGGQARYDLEHADVIVALDSDLLASGPGSLFYTRQFAARRNPDKKMNRLYSVEPLLTPTGTMADHRLAVKPSQVEAVARALALALGVPGVKRGEGLSAEQQRWVERMAWDLTHIDGDAGRSRPPGSTLVIAGDTHPPAVHALACAINHALGNVGRTVFFIEPIVFRPSGERTSLADLAEDMDNGEIDTLFILTGNPVYTAPADLRLGERLRKVELRVHLGQHFDETSRLCQWHLPEAHYLEAWGDARAFDGTATIQQPLIAPLYGGRSMIEVLLGLGSGPSGTGLDAVRATWREWHGKQGASGDFDAAWRQWLNAGIIPGTAAPTRNVTVRGDLGDRLTALPVAPAPEGLEILFRPDPAVFDGRFANNAWLQEWPKPITRLTWDNAALVSPRTAKELGLSITFGIRGGEHGEAYADTVTLRLHGRELTLPAWIVPGHADGAVTVHLGYGRPHAGKVGSGVGFDANVLRRWESPWSDSGLSLTKTGKQHLLACVQGHHSMNHRDLVRSATVAQYKEHPTFAKGSRTVPGHKEQPEELELKEGGKRKPLTLYDPFAYPPDRTAKWGMAINLSTCTGCGACVVACQAENNIPVVGKEQVVRGREMHWLRVDRYFEGDPLEAPENLLSFQQPVPCMHCTRAPCEVVCPVEATVHSADGLNDMIYNRCVGTRYCSNNCPYKVRRFNFYEFADWTTDALKPLRNPEVTVRSRGVMEKCTYCVQRIRAGEIQAQKRGLEVAGREGRDATWNDLRVRDGEVQTACQQVCPAEAIIFGDTNDPKSRVSQLKQKNLNYALLEHLNTEPATTYLADVRNPNPDMG